MAVSETSKEASKGQAQQTHPYTCSSERIFKKNKPWGPSRMVRVFSGAHHTVHVVTTRGDAVQER